MHAVGVAAVLLLSAATPVVARRDVDAAVVVHVCDDDGDGAFVQRHSGALFGNVTLTVFETEVTAATGLRVLAHLTKMAA
eukprot:CAMPEP_0198351968 /NCGR_PEP_ID=MMETSP1450-20131203/105039_1 /TAXON_ID=753684 ORGANISM="Madagascaria erythrocladiodes, Strain CCMP3234" /NCGR_SAMPLE_ID=MMETSP1450 /ASSEMBLY_ACC=CAM_ASM_001115 /LENGTH=79 /DNA_ID=CAMNT_0044057953 /DNA_START=86 /DNA_END=321 /DNA_ORIENTATION=-